MPTAEIVPFQSAGCLQEAPQGNLTAIPGVPDTLATLHGPQRVVNDLETSQGGAAGLAPQAPLLPVSGIRNGVRTIGRGLGWVTWPLWRPMVEICSDTKRILNVWRIPAQHLQGWKAKAQTDMVLWDSWTPEQRASVDRQRGVWTLALLICALIFLVLPYTGFVPLTLLSITWWARSHNCRWPRWANQINTKWQEGNPVPHWDAVRWLLGLPQLGEGQK
jgi:hypothetical protein